MAYGEPVSAAIVLGLVTAALRAGGQIGGGLIGGRSQRKAAEAEAARQAAEIQAHQRALQIQLRQQQIAAIMADRQQTAEMQMQTARAQHQQRMVTAGLVMLGVLGVGGLAVIATRRTA
jgi:hypothetical protein